jgi:molybdate/tungstate transport system substrate-binding protein
MNHMIKLLGRSRSSFGKSSGIATVVVALVIIIIILAASLGYFVLTKTTTTTSTATTSVPSTYPLLLYSADSQVNESSVLESAFHTSTNISVVTAEEGGSGAEGALIAAGDPVSVFLSISHSSVENSSLLTEYPGWAIAFAGDQFGLAYTSASTTTTAAKAVLTAYSTASASNSTSAWYDLFNNLTSGAVKVGISNPVTDPAGYRGWLTLELAGIAYDGGVANEQYFANRMLTSGANVTGASAAALVPALDTGTINFLFYYKSAITSGGLDLMQLANPVNLGEATDNTFYGQASYTVSPTDIETASAITIWITVPKDSTDPTSSVNFVVFVIENYATLLSPFELTNFSPAHLYNDSGYAVPSPIVSLLNSGKLIDEGALS